MATANYRKIARSMNNLAEMSPQELVDLRVRTQEEKDAISEQITIAKRMAAQEGVYEDGDWLIRAEHAAKAKGRLISAIGAEQSRRKKNKSASVEQRFMDVARKLLSAEVFNNIMAEAIDITNGGK